jgi:pilus assembly protein Flp/PilA
VIDFYLKALIMKLVQFIQSFVRDEYGLIAALIAVVIIVSVTAVGNALSTKFNEIATAL